MKSFLKSFFKINRLEFKGFVNPTFQPIFAVRESLSQILILTLSLYILLGPISYKLVKPSFNAEALINVEPKLPRILYQTDPSKYLHSYEDWLRTQVSIITSYPLIEKAIEEYETLGFKWTRPGESKKSAMDRLIAGVKVVNKRETQIISITMESRSAVGSAELVNSIVKVYADYETLIHKNVDNFKLKFLLDKKQKTEADIVSLTEELEELSRKYGTAITEEKNLYVYIEELSDLKKSNNKLLVSRIQAQNKIRELKTKEEILKKIDVEGLVDDSLKTHPTVTENTKNLTTTEYELRAKIAGLAEENFERIFLENKIKDIRTYSDSVLKELKKEQYRITRNKLIADNALDILNTETEMRYLKNSEMELEKELEKSRIHLLEYSSIVLRASLKKGEIERLRERIGIITNRIDEVEVELAIPGRVQVVSWALPPEIDLTSKRRLMLIISFVVSFVLSIFAFILLDFLDPTIKKQSDIFKLLGFSSGGQIIDIIYDLENKNQNPFFAFKNAKNSFFYKEIKQIGVKIDREHKEHGTKVFTILGTASTNGVTTLGINLLSYLDSPANKKIYLDTNYLVPIQNNIPEIKSKILPESGYTLLPESDEFPFKIATGTKNDIYSMANQGIASIESLIRKYKEENDYVFIDSPSVLHFSEALAFARLSDVVILVVRAHDTTWLELKRAIEILDKSEVKVISVIVNRIRPFKGGYIQGAIQDFYKNSLGIHNG